MKKKLVLAIIEAAITTNDTTPCKLAKSRTNVGITCHKCPLTDPDCNTKLRQSKDIAIKVKQAPMATFSSLDRIRQFINNNI